MDVTKLAEPSSAHLAEMMKRATIEGPQGATRWEYDILYGRAAAAARADAVGTEDTSNILVRRGLVGEGFVEQMAEGGWTTHAIFRANRTDENCVQNSAIDDCKSQ